MLHCHHHHHHVERSTLSPLAGQLKRCRGWYSTNHTLHDHASRMALKKKKQVQLLGEQSECVVFWVYLGCVFLCVVCVCVWNMNCVPSIQTSFVILGHPLHTEGEWRWDVGPFLLASLWTIQRSVFWCHEGSSKNYRMFKVHVKHGRCSSISTLFPWIRHVFFIYIPFTSFLFCCIFPLALMTWSRPRFWLMFGETLAGFLGVGHPRDLLRAYWVYWKVVIL